MAIHGPISVLSDFEFHFLGGCASYIYGSEGQTIPCAVDGVGCHAHTNGSKGRGNSISFKTTMETDRTLVATAVVKTDSAGDWPSVAAGDTYIGFLRFDEVRLYIFAQLLTFRS